MRSIDTRAMGARLHILGPDDRRFPAAARAVVRRFALEEQRCSRFRPDSELSRVNATGGMHRLSAPFAEIVGAALAAAAATDGRFDPTVHDALVGAGYDRDLDEVIAGARGRLHPATPCGRWREIVLEGRDLLLPVGVHLDLGGIAKGWTADLAAEEALAMGLPWIVVNAGGDLRVAGRAPSIPVHVEDPDEPAARLALLRVDTGGVATSTVARRAWADGLHHLIDPATGAPVTGDVRQVTAWAPTCAEAEIRATDALLAGDGVTPGPDMIVVTDDRVVVTMAAHAPTEAA
ncbi:MAG TPA: FAD:protein FMN transferase [Ilumatobacteraceae bacterium]|nr:FAD:protein FMN transferase [Ilumatobacteraceae bacterium]